jgi:hypothetical protein
MAVSARVHVTTLMAEIFALGHECFAEMLTFQRDK